MTDIVSANDNVITPSNIEVVKPSAEAVVATDALADVNDFNRVQPRQLSSGVSRGIQQLGGPTLYADSGAQQIVAAPDNIPQVVMGNQATFGEGFYVSKPGIDATTNTDPTNWIFNSNQNIFKIVESKTINVTLGSGAFNVGSIPHNLGFAPIPFAFLVGVNNGLGGSSANIPFPTWLTATADTVNHVVKHGDEISIQTDEQNIYIVYINTLGVSPGTYPVRYYLMQETSGKN